MTIRARLRARRVPDAASNVVPDEQPLSSRRRQWAA
jgi:hypothetical protein